MKIGESLPFLVPWLEEAAVHDESVVVSAGAARVPAKAGDQHQSLLRAGAEDPDLRCRAQVERSRRGHLVDQLPTGPVRNVDPFTGPHVLELAEDGRGTDPTVAGDHSGAWTAGPAPG